MHYSSSEIASLIERFEKQSLPRVEWTHKAHLLVAIWYTSKFGFEEALPIVRELITKHNSAVGTPNSDSEGYHETITKSWLILANAFIKAHSNLSLVDRIESFIVKQELSNSKKLLDYYSSELLFSVNARHNWVEPDLQSFHSRF